MLAALGLAAAGLAWQWRVLGVLLCLMLACGSAQLGWSCYTLPFIVANWCVLLAVHITEADAAPLAGKGAASV
jgi:hypothetical protein